MKRIKRKKRRGIYLLPNLITSASLYCGFYSILSSISGNFYKASMLILLAILFDAMDGRIARLTNSTSRFGMEYDSLSDLIAFGVAPAILVYYWSLHGMGKIGSIAPFIFLICGALRLARFNTQTSTPQNGDNFTGLPIPGAAGIVASLVIFSNELSLFVNKYEVELFILINFIGFLMVSTIKYPAFKSLNMMSARPFHVLVTVILLLLPILYHPEVMIFFLFISYALLGPFFKQIKQVISYVLQLPNRQNVLEKKERKQIDTTGHL